MMDDLRFVTPKDTASYGSSEKRAHEWSPKGTLGKYLRSLDVVALVDRTVFVHGK